MNNQKYSIKDIQFWKVIVSLSLASFFIFAALYIVHPLMPIFVDEFDVSVSVSTLTLSLTIIGLIMGLLLHGILSDQIGRTIFIKLSLAGSIVPFIIMPLFESFNVLLTLRFFQGIVLAGLPAAGLAYIGEEINSRGLGLATALYIGSNAFGGMMGRFVAGYIVERFSWQLTFYLWASVGIIILLIVILLLPKSRFFTPIDISAKQYISIYFYHLKKPELILLFIIGVVLQLSFTGVWTYLPFYLIGEPFNLSLQAISYLYLTYGLGTIGSSLAGMLIEKFHLNTMRTTVIIIMSTGILLTLSNSLIAIIIGLSITCLGFFTAHSLTATNVNLIATNHKGSASSLYLVFYYFGVSMGGTIFAPIWEWAGWIGVISITAILPIVYVVLQYNITRKWKKTVTYTVR